MSETEKMKRARRMAESAARGWEWVSRGTERKSAEAKGEEWRRAHAD